MLCLLQVLVQQNTCFTLLGATQGRCRVQGRLLVDMWRRGCVGQTCGCSLQNFVFLLCPACFVLAYPACCIFVVSCMLLLCPACFVLAYPVCCILVVSCVLLTVRPASLVSCVLRSCCVLYAFVVSCMLHSCCVLCAFDCETCMLAWRSYLVTGLEVCGITFCAAGQSVIDARYFVRGLRESCTMILSLIGQVRGHRARLNITHHI